jgi:CheY-like chemotaxis protein
MQCTILILEDNDDRIAAMQHCLADKFPFFELRFVRSADEAIAWLKGNLSHSICISLDHDLERPEDQPNAPDPGTGREVADHLAAQSPRCPVIVHSTNAHAAIGMEMVLQDAGWHVQRVLPYGDLEWVRAAWLPLVRQAILDDSAVKVRRPAVAIPLIGENSPAAPSAIVEPR